MGFGDVEDEDSGTFTVLVIVLSISILFMLWLISKGVKIVHHAEVMIVERFGKYQVRVYTTTPSSHRPLTDLPTTDHPPAHVPSLSPRLHDTENIKTRFTLDCTVYR